MPLDIGPKSELARMDFHVKNGWLESIKKNICSSIQKIVSVSWIVCPFHNISKESEFKKTKQNSSIWTLELGAALIGRCPDTDRWSRAICYASPSLIGVTDLHISTSLCCWCLLDHYLSRCAVQTIQKVCALDLVTRLMTQQLMDLAC